MTQPANSDPAADQPPAADATPDPDAFVDDGGAAADADAALRENAIKAAAGELEPEPEEDDDDAPPPEPDPQPAPKAKAKKEDDGAEPEPEEDDAAPAPKKSRRQRRQEYKVGQAKRYTEQAEKRLRDAQRLEDRARTERLVHESERRQWTAFDEEARRDPARALARRYGTTPEEFTASGLDAQAAPPALRAENDELRGRLDALEKGVADREKADKQRATQLDAYRRTEHDIKWAVGIADGKQADEYPFFTALHPEARELLVRQEHARIMREDRDITQADFLDLLDERAEPWVQHGRGQNGDSRQTEQGAGDPQPAKKRRKKAPGRVSARAAAEPANRSALTEQQARESAVRLAQRLIDE